MTRALFEARSLTLLDSLIRVGYRGQHHNAWREIEPRGVSQETADAERRAIKLHSAVAENRFSWRAVIAHNMRFGCGPY